MELSCIFFGGAFLVAGFIFAIGKWHIHLPAWKSMTDEEKSKINIVPLCRNIGTVIMICAVLLLTRGFVPAFSGRLFVICMIVWLIAAGCDVAFITKSKRYQNEQ